jgi:hypothetical protein
LGHPVYIKEFEKFRSWMKNINVNVVTEEVVIVYFNRLIEKYAASSLWSTFSMLKSKTKCIEITKTQVFVQH